MIIVIVLRILYGRFFKASIVKEFDCEFDGKPGRYRGEVLGGPNSKNGFGIFTSTDGVIEIIGSWSNDQPHGKCLSKKSDGYYLGNFSNGQGNGQGKRIKLDGDYFRTGFFRHGRCHGQVETIESNGYMHSGPWYDNNYRGIGIE